MTPVLRSSAFHVLDCGRMTLVLLRRRALGSSGERNGRLGRAFEKAVRKKPLAGAADAVYGN